MNITKKGTLLSVVLLSLFFFLSYSLAGVNDSIVGKAPEYFEAMKSAIKEVIDENQDLINKTPDGGVKTPELQSDAIYDKTYAIFLKIVKKFKESELTDKRLSAKRTAYLLTSFLQAGRIAIARSQKAINTETDGSVKLKKFIPAVFGLKVAKRVVEKTDLKLKQTTMGKGIYGSRNPDNTPDKWEIDVLKKFAMKTWRGDRGYAKRVSRSEYRYMKPIHIKKACLTCHGVPIGDKGPYGHEKEGYKEGEVRGGISISIPIK